MFDLKLRHDSDVFHSTVRAIRVTENGTRVPFRFPREEFFIGHVRNEPGASHVRLHVGADGMLAGMVAVANDTFVVEHAWRHVPHMRRHMIVYKARDARVRPHPEGKPWHACGHAAREAREEEARTRAGTTRPTPDEQPHSHTHDATPVHHGGGADSASLEGGAVNLAHVPAMETSGRPRARHGRAASVAGDKTTCLMQVLC